VRRIIPVLALLHLAGCGEDKATILYISVTARDGVPVQPTTLEVIFAHEGERLPTILTKNNRGQPPSIPTSFVIRAEGRKGPAEVTVKSKDDHDYVTGEGTAAVEIAAGGRSDATVTLLPADVQINSRYQEDQIFSTDLSGPAWGRQVSAAGDGSFVVVWEDWSNALARFDIYYRMFDKTGIPRMNAVTGKAEEHVANEYNHIYDMPTVAVQDDGRFVVAWQRNDLTAKTYKIYSRAFTSDGKPDAMSDSGHEIEISGAEVTGDLHASVPFVTALKDDDRGYVVVWQQMNTTTAEVKGRFLGPNGAPTKMFNGKNEPFSVSGSFTLASPPFAAPVVAPGANKGFMVVWNDKGALKGRAFAQKASPIGSAAIDIDTAKSGKVTETAVCYLPYGYAVAWSDSLATPPDADGTSIRFRRFDLNGVAKDDQEFTLNTSVAGNQHQPAIANRPDGSLLAVWTTQHSTPDAGGGIRGRRMLSNGIPVGNDFQINTTTIDAQDKPSVSRHTIDSFIVGFMDNSRTYPDTLGSGIRARLVYPDFAPKDGQIGGLCEVANQNTCAAELYCAQTFTGPRCLNKCIKGQAAGCVNGGTCQTLSGTEVVDLCLVK